MEIHVGNNAGFCFGVKRAVRTALEAAKNEESPVYMLGDIVHNEHVVRDISDAGVQVVDSLDQVTSGTLLIRAHGAIPEVYTKARQKGLKIIDATCSLVLEIHKKVQQLQDEGYTIIIIGDHEHDEVIGIAGEVESAIIVSSAEEAAEQVSKTDRIGVVVQSTQNIDNVQKIVGILVGKCHELHFFNTICSTTTNHQRDIRHLPRENDIMLIIGSHTSANTCRLAEISKELNPRTYQVETAEEVKAEWFIKGIESVGVSAGASTPDYIIHDVIEKIQQIAAQHRKEEAQ